MPKYSELLEEVQKRAAGILATHDVFGHLELLPIEEDSFYSLFLRELLTSRNRFHPPALNLAAWIQEVALEHFNQFTLLHGRSAHLPPLFRWHYAFLPVIGTVVEAVGGDLTEAEIAVALERARERAALEARRQEAKLLLHPRPSEP
ncbi:MAG: hypothetical protein ACE5NC_08690 [Anaerolineae bacterium]